MTEATTEHHPAVVGKLSALDRFLPVSIGVAMIAGLLLGRLIPGLGDTLSAVEIDGISLPIALGLLIMMYPVLAKVRYDRLDTVTGDRRLLIGSLLLNWVLGPALMFALAWLLLPDLPEYRTGLTIAEVASVMRDLGSVDAFSLDGGGSSTLVAREPGATAVSVRNHPSDGRERAVPNGIGVFSTP